MNLVVSSRASSVEQWEGKLDRRRVNGRWAMELGRSVDSAFKTSI